MLLKLDISKAYDRVNWDFLMLVLTKFGFCEEWCKLVFQCVSTSSFFVFVNGVAEGYFPGNRGLRQGNPLSLFLLIIVHLSIVLEESQDNIIKYS